MSKSFIPIDPHTIRDGKISLFDVFFKTANDKIVLYCAAGEAVSDDIREKFTF